MSDETHRACVHARWIDAAPEQVLAAIVDPSRLTRWWGPDGFTSTFEVCDVRPGGDWKLVLHGPDGTDHPNHNVFREVGPERVVVEHLDEVHHVHHFLLTITLDRDADGTKVGWRQVFDTAEHRDQVAPFVLPANEQVLARLAAEVARGSGA